VAGAARAPGFLSLRFCGFIALLARRAARRRAGNTHHQSRAARREGRTDLAADARLAAFYLQRFAAVLIAQQAGDAVSLEDRRLPVRGSDQHVDRGSPGAAVMQLKVPINMLATLLAIASLVAIILIVEAVKRTSTPSAVIQDAFERLEAPD
jgi:hypothetical protein